MVLNGDVDDDIPTLCMKKVRLDTFAPFLVSPYPAMSPYPPRSSTLEVDASPALDRSFVVDRRCDER